MYLMATLLQSIPLLILAFVTTRALAEPVRPVGGVERVLIISVDGMRPDVMLRADMPKIRSLMANGCFTMYAVTTDLAVTLPSHASMLTGVTPAKHGITYNTDDIPADAPHFPMRPTLFELAKRAGYSTALIAGKSKFDSLVKPGTCDVMIVPPVKEQFSDEKVGDHACSTLQSYKPQVTFVHFAGADRTGHSVGWGTPEQIATLEIIDRQIGRVLETLDALQLRNTTLVIVSADHGGSGLNHGANDPRSRYIPWIASAPATLQNYDLTRFRDLNISTEDTFATACFVLGIPTDSDVDGQSVRRAFPQLDLMQATPTTQPTK